MLISWPFTWHWLQLTNRLWIYTFSPFAIHHISREEKRDFSFIGRKNVEKILSEKKWKTRENWEKEQWKMWLNLWFDAFSDVNRQKIKFHNKIHVCGSSTTRKSFVNTDGTFDLWRFPFWGSRWRCKIKISRLTWLFKVTCFWTFYKHALGKFSLGKWRVGVFRKMMNFFRSLLDFWVRNQEKFRKARRIQLLLNVFCMISLHKKCLVVNGCWKTENKGLRIWTRKKFIEDF